MLKSANDAFGLFGEKQISQKIVNLQKKVGGYLIDNFTFHHEGVSVQIDHLYINNSGIFIIETKNYAGDIKGDANDYEWKQTLSKGRITNTLKNPIKQNAGHIYHIKQLITYKNIPIYSIVVFTNKANSLRIKNVDETSVIRLFEFEKTILKMPVVTCDDVTSLIYTKLLSYDEHITKKEHLKEIKNRQKSIKQKHICPRCGADLVLINSKSGKMYGCSNFPKCRFKMKYFKESKSVNFRKIIIMSSILLVLILIAVCLIFIFSNPNI